MIDHHKSISYPLWSLRLRLYLNILNIPAILIQLCNLSEVIIAVRFTYTIYERYGRARFDNASISREATVETSRPFNLAIIQRLLLRTIDPLLDCG